MVTLEVTLRARPKDAREWYDVKCLAADPLDDALVYVLARRAEALIRKAQDEYVTLTMTPDAARDLLNFGVRNPNLLKAVRTQILRGLNEIENDARARGHRFRHSPQTVRESWEACRDD